jgi:hypothetical protein
MFQKAMKMCIIHEVLVTPSSVGRLCWSSVSSQDGHEAALGSLCAVRVSTTRDGCGERKGSARRSGAGLVSRNVVVELLELFSELVADVVTLRLLGLELELGRHQLEHLVLGLAGLECHVSRSKGSCRVLGAGGTYGESVLCCARGGLDGGVKGVSLGLVGSLVDVVEELDVGLGDAGGVVCVEGCEDLQRFLLSVAGLSA